MELSAANLIPWISLVAAVLCGVCVAYKPLRKFAGVISVVGIALGFVLTLAAVKPGLVPGGTALTAFEWIHVGDFKVDFAYFYDPLTFVMLSVVTGVGTLVAWYATGYMKGDRGYARFFFGVSLFIFAMTTLVMADNLVLLYLGWEGVGLCSYLLIGYYYDTPTAVAAAKKAFIVNRIGDLGFALGIFLMYQTFGTVQVHEVVELARAMPEASVTAAHLWIPFLLMLGAFGKSAQLPLYVWLPDAMAGPTPVSALIHAATMVTAGVYMIVRLLPVFALSPAALPTVAVVGGLTAMFAATIALCQNDLKKVFAYSTVSQLGYMFLGVGALEAFGGVYHLYTHAFFKALLFLTSGSVMHALAGQLDMQKISGLRHKMPMTCWLMFVGCLALAGFPLTSGFFSKDTILAAAMGRGLEHGPYSGLFMFLAIIGLITAFLTAFYTFRLWFRVFWGPEQYEMGEEHHAAEDDHGHGHGDIAVEHDHGPHEMPFASMNLPLLILAIGAALAGLIEMGTGYLSDSIAGSTAALGHATEHVVEGAAEAGEHHDSHTLHYVMMGVSGVISIVGIGLAYYFHLANRAASAAIAKKYAGLVTLLENKWYVDELYDAAIVKPLYALGKLFQAVDQLVVDGIVSVVAFVPRLIGYTAQPTQQGKLQGYGVGMATGIAVLVLIVYMAM